MKAIFRGLSVSMLALAAAGCTTPNPTPLDRPGDVPQAFTAPVADKQAPIWPEANWWMNFKADELPGLIDTAQKENLDLAAAAARVLEAEAQDGVAFANLLPVVNLQGCCRRATAPMSAPSRTGVDVTSNSFNAGLAASYSADFWGLNRDRLYQARENLRSARYAETVVGLTVQSSVAQQYFTVLATARAHRHRAPEYRRRQPHSDRGAGQGDQRRVVQSRSCPGTSAWSPPSRRACPA